jgi:hypothetical protein
LRVRLSGLDIPYHGPHCLRHYGERYKMVRD